MNRLSLMMLVLLAPIVGAAEGEVAATAADGVGEPHATAVGKSGGALYFAVGQNF